MAACLSIIKIRHNCTEEELQLVPVFLLFYKQWLSSWQYANLQTHLPTHLLVPTCILLATFQVNLG